MEKDFYNLFAPILLKYRYKSKVDAFKEFGKFKKQVELPPITKGVIIVAPIRVSPISNLFEGLYGFFLRMKGYDVRVVLCGQHLNFCETHDSLRNHKITCSLCYLEQKRFIKYFGLKPIWLNNTISNKTKGEIKSFVFSLGNEEDFSLKYKNIDLTKNLSSALQRYTLKSTPNIKDNKVVFKKIITTSITMVEAFFAIQKKYKIEHIVISHGIYASWGSFISAAKKNDIKSLIWGRGYIGQGNLIIGRNKSYLEDFIDEPVELFKNIEIDDNKKSFVLDYYKQKMNPNSSVDRLSYYKNISIETGIDIRKELNIPHGNICYGMFTNIPWDGQAFCSTPNFPTIKSFITTVINWFIKNSDVYLIIRAHPAELAKNNINRTERFEDVLYEAFPKLPENVIFLKPNSIISSYNLVSVIDAGIVYASTIALELAIQKLPIVQVGKNALSNKEVVFDINTESELYQLLDLIKLKKLFISDERYKNTLKYAYYWLKKRHIPEELIILKNLEYIGYKFNNINDFLNNKTLNIIFNSMINDEYYVYDK